VLPDKDITIKNIAKRVHAGTLCCTEFGLNNTSSFLSEIFSSAISFLLYLKSRLLSVLPEISFSASEKAFNWN
jgi:hypothetical protein